MAGSNETPVSCGVFPWRSQQEEALGPSWFLSGASARLPLVFLTAHSTNLSADYLGIIFLTFHFSPAFGIRVEVSGIYSWEQNSSWPEPEATSTLDNEKCICFQLLSHHPCVFLSDRLKILIKNNSTILIFQLKRTWFFFKVHKATFSKELNIHIYGRILVKASFCWEKEDTGSFPLNCYSIILFCSSANCPFCC